MEQVVRISPKAESSTVLHKKSEILSALSETQEVENQVRERRRKGKEENSTRLSRIPHANSRNLLNITRNPSKKGTHDDPPLLEGRFAPGFLGNLGGEDLGVDGRARVGGNGWASEGDNVSLRMRERSERRRGRDATGNVVVGRRVPAGDEFLLLLVLDVVVFLRRR